MPDRPLDPLGDLDPFDLPEWLGTAEVTWHADDGVAGARRVPGRLGDRGPRELGCDLLAVDLAFPEPVVGDDVRRRAHQAWQHGEVLVQGRDDPRGAARGVVLAVPGSAFTADLVLDAVARLARAVGADPQRWAVHLRVGLGRG